MRHCLQVAALERKHVFPGRGQRDTPCVFLEDLVCLLPYVSANIRSILVKRGIEALLSDCSAAKKPRHAADAAASGQSTAPAADGAVDEVYSCRDCRASFLRAGLLRAHRLTHVAPAHYPHACADCGERFRTASELARHSTASHADDGRSQLRQNREAAVIAAIRSEFPESEHRHYWEPQFFVGWGCWTEESCKGDAFKARVDLSGQSCFSGTALGQVLMEIDERGHASYKCECDRMINVTSSMRAAGNPLPIVWIRFNPDRFSVDDAPVRRSMSERMAILLNFLKNLKFDGSDTVKVAYFFYNCVTLSARDAARLSRPDLQGKLVPATLLHAYSAAPVLEWMTDVVV